MIKSCITLVGVISTIVSALNAPIPRPTDDVANALGYGTSPVPTTAPSLPHDILKRQTGGSSIIGYYGPDNTCGYVSGILASIKTCDVTEICAAVVVSSVASMGCCDIALGTCEFLGNCINSVGYWSSSLCNTNCMTDPNTVKCTAASKPYCYSYLVPGISMGFYSCDSTYSNTFAPFLTTYSGENDARSWLPLYDSGASGVGAFNTPSFLLSATDAGTVGGFGSLSTQPVSSTAGSSSGLNNSTIRKKKSRAGPIVGGVIGGLVVIGLIAFGVIFLCMKKNQPKYQRQVDTDPAGSALAPVAIPMAPMAAAAIPQMQQQQNQQQVLYPPPNGYAQTPTYSYYTPTKDGHIAPTGYANSIPPSPAPMYSSQSPPPPSITPQPVTMNPAMQMASPVPQGPPPGVVEAGSIPVQRSPHTVVSSPVPVASPDHPQPAHSQNAAVELGTNYAIPTRNTEGQPLFEAQ